MVVIAKANGPFGRKFGITPMRNSVWVLAFTGLAACQSSWNQEAGGAGVGFQNYGQYQNEREAALNGAYGQQSMPPQQGGFSTERIGSAIDAATGQPVDGQVGGYGAVQPAQPQYGNQTGGGVGAVIGGAPGGQLDPNRPRADTIAGVASVSSEVDPNNAGISDENDFGAVSSRETIESDAERIARNRDQYQVIQPGALPTREGTDGSSNIVGFAMSTSHAPGTPMYKRSAIGLSNPERACSRFASPDLAQEAFLAAGGPDRDRKGLDPDGDGYACSWDPRPFRAN
jgi:hypothetical protein